MKQIYKAYDLRVVKQKEYTIRETEIKESGKVNNPSHIVEIAKLMELAERPYEVLVLFTLDVKNNITGIFEVSSGTVDMSIVHPRDVYSRALLQNAKSILLLHNHPSGDVTPSQQDLKITGMLKEAGELLGIDLLDHIIIGEDYKYYSIIERGL